MGANIEEVAGHPFLRLTNRSWLHLVECTSKFSSNQEMLGVERLVTRSRIRKACSVAALESRLLYYGSCRAGFLRPMS